MKSQWSPTGRQARVSNGTLDSGGEHAGVQKGRNQEIRKVMQKNWMEAIIFRVVCVFSLQGQFNCLHLNFEFSANKRRYVYTHSLILRMLKICT